MINPDQTQSLSASKSKGTQSKIKTYKAQKRTGISREVVPGHRQNPSSDLPFSIQ